MELESNVGVYSGVRSEHPSWKWVVAVCQIGIYPGLILMRFFLVHKKLIRTSKIEISKNPHVLYANHQSQLDPLLLCVSLPPKAIFKLIPYRFFVANAYFSNPLMASLLGLMGGFPAHPHSTKPFGLDHARYLINTNQTVVIFPQGKRTTERIAKPGISALAMEPNVRLMPMHIDWKNRLSCQIRVGEIRNHADQKLPEQLMQDVYDLAMR